MYLPTRRQCTAFLIYVFAVAVALALGYGVVFLLFGLLLPFTAAYTLAFCLQPVVRALHRRFGWERHRVGTVVALLFFALLGSAISYLVYRLLGELLSLFSALEQNREAIVSELFLQMERILQKIPFLRARLDGDRSLLRARLWQAFSAWGTEEGRHLPRLLERFASALPISLLSFFVFLFASVSFCADFSQVNAFFLSRLPKDVRAWVRRAKDLFVGCVLRYLRAYFYLFLLTFFELLVGLTLLRVPYALALAFLIAALDILPILGVGVVLIPFSLFALLFGSYGLSLGLLILFAVITLLRQVAEPHILGAQIGLHPLPTLAATYLGFRLFGFWGLVGAPLLFSVLAQAYHATKKEPPVTQSDEGNALD